MTKKRVCANNLNMSRRTILSTLPMSALATAAPQVATADTPDPVVIAYREWLAARQEWRELADIPGNGNFDDPRSLEAEERENAAAIKMVEGDPTSLEGIAALVALLWSDATGMFSDPDQPMNCSASYIEHLAVQSIWKFCSGMDGYPVV